MEYDPGDGFSFGFQPNGNLYGSKSKQKLSPGLYFIQLEMENKNLFF